MNIMDYILSIYNQTKEEYIEECKRCFLKEDSYIQEQLENASTEELQLELKRHNWTTTYDDYCKAIKYELMLRTNFEIGI